MVILIFFFGTNSLISWRRAHVFACSACCWCRGGCRWCCSHSGSDSCGREPARKTAVDWLASGCFASFPFPWLWSMIVVHERRNNDLHHPYHVSVKFHIFKSTGTSLWGTLFPLHESWRKSNWHQLTSIDNYQLCIAAHEWTQNCKHEQLNSASSFASTRELGTWMGLQTVQNWRHKICSPN